MRLETATESHVLEIMGWFPDLESCRRWGGPDLRFPFTEATFKHDVRWREVPSFALVAADNELLGFGQYYLRLGRCHLARLVIAPARRGRRLGALLIAELCRRGCLELGVSACSLFVMADNAPAIRLYTRMGFVPQPYPEPLPFEGTLYLVAAADKLRV
ncbi:MAG TPA: GNAT family N-acetyltransferase [Verrucomicrobiota bacterium]|nr:GNAT family N-acetyltransferase [Verrucomicrobiota bacterium]